MERLVVHVGPHKTGTSYIQARLFSDRSALIEKGWLYPTVGNDGWDAQHTIAHNPDGYLSPEGSKHADLLSLADRARAEKLNIILSAEGFRVWSASNIEQLANHLEAKHVDIVYAIRDPFTVFYSYWAEEVKQGYSGALPVRFMQNFVNQYESRILNPLIDLERFGSDKTRIHILYYDAIMKKDLDICDVLTSEVLGVGPVERIERTEFNRRLPIEFTEFLRLLTFRHSGTKVFSGSKYRLALMRELDPTECNEIANLVAAHGRDAQRALEIPRDNDFYRTIISRLKRGKYFKVFPKNGEEDIPTDPIVYRFFDLDIMMNQPKIREVVRSVEQRMTALGFPPKSITALEDAN